MLRVSIASSDFSCSGIYETNDRIEAAALALTDAVKRFGFHKENMICRKFPSDFKLSEGAFGLLVMPDDDINDPEELEYLVSNDSTTWIYVSAELNRMFCD